MIEIILTGSCLNTCWRLNLTWFRLLTLTVPNHYVFCQMQFLMKVSFRSLVWQNMYVEYYWISPVNLIFVSHIINNHTSFFTGVVWFLANCDGTQQTTVTRCSSKVLTWRVVRNLRTYCYRCFLGCKSGDENLLEYKSVHVCCFSFWGMCTMVETCQLHKVCCVQLFSQTCSVFSSL